MSVKSLVLVLCAVIFCGAFIGCDSDGENEKLTLSEYLPNPVTVVLSGDLGSIAIGTSSIEMSEDEKTAFPNYVGDGTISITVVNSDTAVSYEISSGTKVDAEPVDSGEYSVTVSDYVASIKFWNSFDGSSITSVGNYSATIKVLDNDYFTAEEITAAVNVQYN